MKLKKIRLCFTYFTCFSLLFVSNVGAVSCEEALSDDLVTEICNIFYTIGAVALIIGIVMGMVDFIKVLVSGDNGELKKVATKFAKRLIAIALFIAIPALASWLLDIAGVTSDTCIK